MGFLSSLFSKDNDVDEENDDFWHAPCRYCGEMKTESGLYCSEECSLAAWEERQEKTKDRRYNTNPNCPACGGAGSCQLCEDEEW